MKIQDQIVLVTGASGGIGAATARAMARAGGQVVLLARNAAKLDAVASEIVRDGGTAWVFPVDISDALAVAVTVNRIRKDVGHPDILVNNAGAGRWLFVEETEDTEAVDMMAVPYFGAFYVTRAFLPEMLKKRRGHIVNVTSVAAFFAWPGATGYTAARWAMRGFSQALRADLYGTGVGVTLIAPGKVSSGYFEHNAGAEERIPWLGKFYPTITPERVAQLIVRSVERNRREVIPTFRYWATVWMARVCPRLVDWLLVKTGWRHDV